jgi:hypothetical protein
MTWMVRWIGSEIREPPSFYGLVDLEEFLMKFELEVIENQRLPLLDIYLKYTPSHCCGTHKENINN